MIAKPSAGDGVARLIVAPSRGRPRRRDGRTTLNRVLAVRLEEPRGALAAADAHGHDAVARLAAELLDGDRAHHPRAGHAERVADRDRAAVDVELLRIDAQAIAAVDDLRGERLVQLPHVDVVDLQAVTLQELGYRVDGTDAHLVRLAAGDGEAAEDELRANAEGLGAVHRHHERRAGAVGELRGIAGGHGPLAGVLVEVRWQFQEPLERRVGAITLVLLDVVRLLADHRARLLVEDAARDVHRRHLFLEESFLLGARRTLLTQERVAVLGLAADLVALGDDLGRVAHYHVDAGEMLLHPRVRVAVALRHRDRLDAAADHDVDAVADDVVRRDRDRLEPRGAEAVQGEP